MSLSSRSRWVALPCAAVALALIASGCASSDDSSSSSGAASTSVDQSVLGPVKKASGAPIKVAFAYPGEAVSTAELPAAQAAVQYLNEYQGGINGRPLELSVQCADNFQVNTARDCANKFVASDAVAALTGVDGTTDAIVGITSPAKMPYMSATPGSATFTDPYSYVLNNPIANLVGTQAKYAQQQGFKKVAILTLDVPAAVEPLKQIGGLAYANAGAKSDVVTVPLGTADMTPQIQAALKDDPQMFHIVGDSSFCVAALKAMRTLNATQPIVAVSQCVDPAVASQIPDGYSNVIVAAGQDVNPGEEDTKIFDAVMQKYADNPTKAKTGSAGYQAILGFARSLTGMTGDITRASIAAHLNAMPAGQPLPLGAGATFQCGSKPIAIAPNVCTKVGLIGKADKDGNLTDVKTIDSSDLFTPPSS